MGSKKKVDEKMDEDEDKDEDEDTTATRELRLRIDPTTASSSVRTSFRTPFTFWPK